MIASPTRRIIVSAVGWNSRKENSHASGTEVWGVNVGAVAGGPIGTAGQIVEIKIRSSETKAGASGVCLLEALRAVCSHTADQVLVLAKSIGQSHMVVRVSVAPIAARLVEVKYMILVAAVSL